MQGTMTENHDAKGRFIAGNKLSRGRPVGARNRLGTAFVEALEADFNEHGAQAIADCRNKFPGKYLAVICQLLPREVDLAIEADVQHHVRVQQILFDYETVLAAADRLGVKTPLLLEAADDD